jgi:hypothetical protein
MPKRHARERLRPNETAISGMGDNTNDNGIVAASTARFTAMLEAAFVVTALRRAVPPSARRALLASDSMPLEVSRCAVKWAAHFSIAASNSRWSRVISPSGSACTSFADMPLARSIVSSVPTCTRTASTTERG